ncbi:MAG: DUF1127 domain-containing protein [Gammaproteobacteria bacterium]|nr:DUF1127 domain-containing protein [Gammaproteobacteria bacterium]
MSNYFNSYKESFSLALTHSTPTSPNLSGFINLITRMGHVVLTWHRRSKQRRALANLDRRLQKDIGLSTEEVFDESSKPFGME